MPRDDEVDGSRSCAGPLFRGMGFSGPQKRRVGAALFLCLIFTPTFYKHIPGKRFFSFHRLERDCIARSEMFLFTLNILLWRIY